MRQHGQDLTEATHSRLGHAVADGDCDEDWDGCGESRV